MPAMPVTILMFVLNLIAVRAQFLTRRVWGVWVGGRLNRNNTQLKPKLKLKFKLSYKDAKTFKLVIPTETAIFPIISWRFSGCVSCGSVPPSPPWYVTNISSHSHTIHNVMIFLTFPQPVPYLTMPYHTVVIRTFKGCSIFGSTELIQLGPGPKPKLWIKTEHKTHWGPTNPPTYRKLFSGL